MDPDIAAMDEAYRQLSGIPACSNRRRAALLWLYQRVSTELKHELDRIAIEAAAKAAQAHIDHGRLRTVYD